jgi:stage II sporulation protein D
MAGGTSTLLAGVPDIRIGVVPTTNAVALGSAADYSIKDKSNGVVLFSGNNGAATVSLISAPTSYWRLQVTCSNNATYIAGIKAAAEGFGIPTLTSFNATANCTRLYIGQFPLSATFGVRNAFRIDAGTKGLTPEPGAFFAQVAPGGPTVYKVTQGNVSKESVNPVIVTSTTGIVTIGGVFYRGVGEANVNSGGALAGINQLPLEQYLYGVVPRELGPAAFPEVEAQKAQAIAARTYAVAGFGKRANDKYDLLGTTADQVYGGYSAEHPVSSAAVDATAGRVLTFQDKLITALYSSTSGGHTADNEEAFSGDPVPYLRGVPDAERGRSLEHVPSLDVFRFHGNGNSLRGAKEGDYDSDWGRLHRWTFEWSAAEMLTVVRAATNRPDIGAVNEINVVERGPSGRVLRLEYVTDVGTFAATKDAIRASLRTIGAGNALVNLPSTLFFIEPVLDHRTKAIDGYRVYGGGFGHGVGMSQTGAVGMAEKGHSYEEILRHYYRGTELTSWY